MVDYMCDAQIVCPVLEISIDVEIFLEGLCVYGLNITNKWNANPNDTHHYPLTVNLIHNQITFLFLSPGTPSQSPLLLGV